jgi:hypothetical protein
MACIKCPNPKCGQPICDSDMCGHCHTILPEAASHGFIRNSDNRDSDAAFHNVDSRDKE